MPGEVSQKIYIVALANLLSVPINDNFINFGETKKVDLTIKGRLKKYMIKFMYFVQSDSTLRLLISVAVLNCIYERLINSPYQFRSSPSAFSEP